ncbi:MAG: hypothetical protein JXQ74_00345 [Alphaproteobacteria bacterium]|nr:hypothetical protein [Alphaproteobacteria bacterium]
MGKKKRKKQGLLRDILKLKESIAELTEAISNEEWDWEKLALRVARKNKQNSLDRKITELKIMKKDIS